MQGDQDASVERRAGDPAVLVSRVAKQRGGCRDDVASTIPASASTRINAVCTGSLTSRHPARLVHIYSFLVFSQARSDMEIGSIKRR